MIELTKDQQAALDGPEQPAIAVDPRTGQRYRQVRQVMKRFAGCSSLSAAPGTTRPTMTSSGKTYEAR